MSVEKQIHNFVEISVELAALLGQENALLQQQKTQEIDSLQDRKHRLADLYQAQIQHMHVSRSEYSNLSDASKKMIRMAIEQVQRASAENFLRINAAKHANEALLQTVADSYVEYEQERGRNGPKTYSHLGHRQRSHHVTASTMSTTL